MESPRLTRFSRQAIRDTESSANSSNEKVQTVSDRKRKFSPNDAQIDSREKSQRAVRKRSVKIPEKAPQPGAEPDPPSASDSASDADLSSSFVSPIFFPSPTVFSTWLSRHHATTSEVFVGYFKKHTGRQGLSWSAAVDEALCWGWIDGQARGLDDSCSAQRFTPRRPRSHWSLVNVAKVARLEKEGRMQEPGRRAFAARTQGNTGKASHECGEVELSNELRARLEEDETVWRDWEDRPKGYRKQVKHWVMGAKKEETRVRRLEELIEACRKGGKVSLFSR